MTQATDATREHGRATIIALTVAAMIALPATVIAQQSAAKFQTEHTDAKFVEHAGFENRAVARSLLEQKQAVPFFRCIDRRQSAGGKFVPAKNTFQAGNIR